jgi:hypothetical protein
MTDAPAVPIHTAIFLDVVFLPVLLKLVPDGSPFPFHQSLPILNLRHHKTDKFPARSRTIERHAAVPRVSIYRDIYSARGKISTMLKKMLEDLNAKAERGEASNAEVWGVGAIAIAAGILMILGMIVLFVIAWALLFD